MDSLPFGILQHPFHFVVISAVINGPAHALPLTSPNRSLMEFGSQHTRTALALTRKPIDTITSST